MKDEAGLIILDGGLCMDGVDIFVVSREQWRRRLRWVVSCTGWVERLW